MMALLHQTTHTRTPPLTPPSVYPSYNRLVGTIPLMHCKKPPSLDLKPTNNRVQRRSNKPGSPNVLVWPIAIFISIQTRHRRTTLVAAQGVALQERGRGDGGADQVLPQRRIAQITKALSRLLHLVLLSSLGILHLDRYPVPRLPMAPSSPQSRLLIGQEMSQHHQATLLHIPVVQVSLLLTPDQGQGAL